MLRRLFKRIASRFSGWQDRWGSYRFWVRRNVFSSGEIRYQVPESEIPEGYVENMNQLIATRFSISADILNTAYYNFVFDKGKVYVNRLGWNSKK